MPEHPTHVGKVAVVTGAAGGLGRASAERLADDGASVVVVDIDGDAAEGVARSLPGKAVACQADVSLEEDVDRYMNVAVDAFGRVDLHHLNAGIFGSFDQLPAVTVADFDRVMAVNVRGQFLGLRAAFRAYARQRSRGSVVLTASIASFGGGADLIAYHTSKHATIGLIRGASVFGGPLGIRVNGVAPGIVPTELFSSAGAVTGGTGDMEQRASTMPLRRAGRASEIASVVSFLLGDDASYTTGQVLAADGGGSAVNPARPAGGAGAWSADGLDRAFYTDEWSWSVRE